MPDERLTDRALRLAIDQAPDAVVCADATGRIVFLNPAAERAFGHTNLEARGQELTLLMPERFHSGHRHGFRRYLETNEAHVIGRTVELAGRRKDGTEFPIELSIAEAREEGAARVFVAIIRDITERKAAEEVQRKAEVSAREVERLKEMNRFKGQFTNMAAHELLTPLTPLRTLVRVMTMNPHVIADPKLSGQFDTITRNLNRLTHLVQDLLDASRMDAGKLVLRKASVDLSEVTRHAVASYEAEAKRSGVTVEARLEPGLTVMGDEAKLTQVAFNLVSNAVKFTPKGGKVLVSTKRTAETAQLTVSDTGMGMDAAFLPRLFEPFSRAQLHDVEVQPGTGLGLYVSKGIVGAHGGKIVGESPGKGKGTTFTVSLPL